MHETMNQQLICNSDEHIVVFVCADLTAKIVVLMHAYVMFFVCFGSHCIGLYMYPIGNAHNIIISPKYYEFY